MSVLPRALHPNDEESRRFTLSLYSDPKTSDLAAGTGLADLSLALFPAAITCMVPRRGLTQVNSISRQAKEILSKD